MRRLLTVVAAALAVLLVAGTVLVGTAPGTQALLGVLARSTGEHVRWSSAEGTLPRGLVLRDLRLAFPGFALSAREAAITVDLTRLLTGVLHLRRLSLRDGELGIDAGQETAEASAPLGLPLAVQVDALRIEAMTLRTGERSFVLDTASGALALSRDARLGLDALQLASGPQTLSLDGSAGLNAPYPADLRIDIQGRDPDGGSLRIQGRLLGDADGMSLSLDSAAPWQAALDLRARNLTGEPALTLDLSLDLTELARLGDDGAGSLALRGTVRGELFTARDSTLNLAMALDAGAHGAWDIAAVLGATSGRAVSLTRLAVRGPGAALVDGGGSLLGPGLDPAGLDLTLNWQQLASPAVSTFESPTGQLRITAPDGLSLALQAEVAAAALPRITLAANADLQAQSLRLRSLSAASSLGRLQASGDIDLGDQGSLALRGSWADIQAADPAARTLRSPAGRFTLAGTLAAWTLLMNGELAVAGREGGTLSLSAEGTRTGVPRLALEAALDEATLALDGQAEWSPLPAARLALRGTHLDPALLAPAFPGDLGIEALVQASVPAAGPQWQVRLQHIGGELRALPVQMSGAIGGEPGRIDIDDLRLASGQARLRANGALAADASLDWSIEAPQLADLWPEASGSIQGSGSLTGQLRTALLRAELQARAVRLAGLRMDAVQLDADADFGAAGRLDLALTANGLALGERRLDTVRVNVDGTTEAHRLAARISGPDLAATLAAAGGLDDASDWQGQLTAASLRLAGFDWTLIESVSLLAGAGQQRLGRHCWQSEAGRLCLGGSHARDGQWQAGLDSDRLDLAAFSSARLALSGRVDGLRLQASGAAGQLDTLTAGATVGSGGVELQRHGEEPLGLAFTGLDLEAAVGADAASASLTLQPGVSGAGRLTASLSLPPAPWQLDQLGALTMDGRAQLQLDSLEALQPLLGELDNVIGRATLEARIRGTPSAPRIDAQVDASALGAMVPALGLQVSADTLAARIDEDGRFELDTTLRSGEGSAVVDVSGRIAPGATSLSASLRGSALQVVNLPEAEVVVSPDLRLTLEDRLASLTGELVVPAARLEPTGFGNGATTLSDDVTVVDAEQAPSAPALAITSDITITLGSDVRFSARGFNTGITGSLRVQDQPGSATRASGELRLVGGAFTAYGQDLRVQSGRIIYAGGPVDDPGIDATAVREVDSVRVGIKASGRLREPVIALFSSPAMDDNEILSWMLLGRSLRGASQSEANVLMSAATSMGLKRGELISKGIASRFGIDDFSLSGSPSEGQIVATVGKYLSPRLYIGYGVGLLEPSNTVRMRYDLFEHWQVEAETGSTTGADLLYTIER
jgi:translocation and assembly module TamB